ncbi:MAG: alpha/beta fold hydrolase [Chloroflexota bacterium]
MSELRVVDTATKEKPKRRLWLWIPTGIVAVLAIFISGFVVWAINPGVDLPAITQQNLQSTDTVTVTDSAWISFMPTSAPPTTGFIFYPGARVPAQAYTPLAQQIASQGYLVVIVKPPINLSILNTTQAAPVIEHFSAVQRWVVGGHSMGGAVAAIYAENRPEEVEGVVLLAAYPPNDSLLDNDIEIASIYGTEDGIATLDEIDASRDDLPTDTLFVPIAGGNHAQFGYYGEQSGDNPATIAHDQQIAQTATVIVDLLTAVATSN